ncbi:hypothetical protein CK203_079721 [Vitis vinifera]|uniref:Integrase catalytic domain-containing protein n=1 Tax=Vitis vinifera TaxID=29760 RepID=A0A438ECQ3_VITVI|nr:hypothetical protein CK203_079721 [Vitis vinifera]
MIVKSRDRSDHLAALERFFERIRQFRLRLNPKKCTFGVTSGKLLGYMVSERGIEVDPDKIRAILTCLHRGQRERKSQPTVWDDQCQRAFERIREYLLSPPVFGASYTRPSSTLILVRIRRGLGCMLAQLDDSGKDRAIYYLIFRAFDIRLDPLRYLFDRPALVGRLMRWLVLLTEFDIHYVTQKSIRGSIVADHLASLPVSDARAIDDDFPDEDVAAVTSLSVRLAFSDRHPATNNIVEYEACILGLETASSSGLDRWRCLLLVGDLRFEIYHLPRAQNQFADALATLASMIDIPVATVRPLLIESRSAPAYCCLIDDVEPDDGLPWYHDIYHFLRLGVYPEAATAKDKRALRQLATRFVIVARHCIDDRLMGCYYYVWTAPLPIGDERGSCGSLRTTYGRTYVGHTRRSHSRAALRVHALTSPWPFSVWGIDIIGKISPKSSSGHEFILVAIDYFTKWVEAASYARLTSSGVASFIRSHIICRYGVPHELISDRGYISEQRATPYSLVYGMGGDVTVEIEMGSLRVALEQQIPEADWAQARFDQLNLLDERRLRAADHVCAYQRKMAALSKSGSSPDHYR